jgi:hypothetical protein
MQMQKALDDILCQRYPILYAARNDNAQSTAMCWGFQVGDGWFGIIDALSEALLALAHADGDPCPVAQQVKQKFGSLRFHIDAPNKYRVALELAEELSRRVCEVSGGPGRLCRVDGRELVTLAPGVRLSRKGVYREIAALPADVEPVMGQIDIPPLAFSLDEMLSWRTDVLSGPVDIPAGWYDLTDAVLHVRQRGGGEWSKSARICRIWRDKSGLRLDWTESSPGSRALSEAASAFSRRIDPLSGRLT